jgi:hypothetical protein
MKDLAKTIIVILLSVVLMACGSTAILNITPTVALAATQFVTTAPTFTPLPTATPKPSLTPTPVPTDTPIPATATLPPPTLTPSATPLTDWNGVPIMPGATDEKVIPYGFEYMIAAPASDVEKFYKQEMAKLGWIYENSGSGSNGTVSLNYLKGQRSSLIAFVPQGNDMTKVGIMAQ